MPDIATDLLDALHARLSSFPQLVLGYSGGLDSTVLLAALVRAGFADRLLAVHVHHGLQAEADDWPAHCREQAASLGVAIEVCHLGLEDGANLEERARDARRQALLAYVPQGAALLLAQHADDQAETLLLRLLRGAGPRGLAAMAEVRDWHGRPLLRPLLAWSRVNLEQIAVDWRLAWIEDPSNLRLHHDRNYLRGEIMPRLRERWPAVTETLARDAALQGEAAGLLDELAGEDLQRLGREDGSLALQGVTALSAARRANLVHGWLRRRGLNPPERKVLARLDSELLLAGDDRQPEIAWPGAALLRFREGLYLLTDEERAVLSTEQDIELSSGEYRIGPLALRIDQGPAGDGAPGGMELPLSISRVRLAPALGGERLHFRGMHRQVSELWRQRGLAPWRRRQLPLLWQGDELLAAAAIGTADKWRPDHGEPAWRVTVRLPGEDWSL